MKLGKIFVYFVIILSALAGYFFVKNYVLGNGVRNDATNNEESMVHSFTITDEKSFLENMIPHHLEAVTTSQTLLESTRNPGLKKFLVKVTNTQNKEIDQMKKWLMEWYSVDYYPNSNYEPMMPVLEKYTGDVKDKIYIEGMITHHRGAVEMAKKALTLKLRSEITDLAALIVSTQESEIEELKTLLVEYGDIKTDDGGKHNIEIH